MKINDAISGLLLFCLGAAILFAVSGYPRMPGQNIGPAAFPGVLAVLLMGCAVILIGRGLRDRTAPLVQLGAWMRSPAQVRNFFAITGSLVFYIFCVDWLGFIPTGLILLGGLFVSFGVRLALVLPLAVLVTLVIHTAFYKLLRVPLPWGLLQGLHW